MKKRGQVTTFMIIGLVLLIVIVLIFSLRQAGIGINTPDYLNSKLESVDKSIKECTREKLLKASEMIGKQGGVLEPVGYRMHDGYRVNYLCTNIPNSPQCLNNMIFKEDVEREIEEYLNFYVPECVDLDKISQQVFFPELRSAKFEADVDIRNEDVLVKVNYPVSVLKGDSEVTLDIFQQSISLPLGKLLDSTYDIVNAEARDGLFFTVPYMIANRGEVEVFTEQQEYPDKIYVLNERNSDYIFQFAVEGERG